MSELVLIPGLGSDAAVWSPTIAALGGDVRCMVGDTLQDGSLPAMAQRILAASPARFVLAGVSMGGMVALEMVRAEPRRVIGLAIVDSNAFPDDPEQKAQRRRAIAALRSGLDLQAAGEAGLARLVHPTAAADIRREIVDMGIRVGAEPYARQIEAVLQRPDQRPILGTIAVPTSVVSGADDIMIPVDRARAMAALVPQSVVEVIPECGHLPPIEKPAIVAEILRKLIARSESDVEGASDMP